MLYSGPGCGTTTLSPRRKGCGTTTLCNLKSVGFKWYPPYTLPDGGGLCKGGESLLEGDLVEVFEGASSLKILLIPKESFGAELVWLEPAPWLELGVLGDPARSWFWDLESLVSL